MVIESFKIKNYKKIDSLKLTFDSKINVIIGDNEAGKSTIIEAFLDLLFVDPTTKSQGFINKVKSWNRETLPELEVVFTALGSKFLFSKDFNNKTLLLKNLNTEKKVETYKESLDYIKKIIGIKDIDIFKRTAYINQGDIVLKDTSKDLLHEVTTTTGSSREQSSAQKVIKDLEKELGLLTKGLDRPSNSPGAIKLQQDKITSIENILADKQRLWERKQVATTQKENSTIELKRLNKEIEGLEELLRNNETLKDSREELENVVKEVIAIEKKIKNVEKLSSQNQILSKQLGAFKSFSDNKLEKDSVDITRLEGSIKYHSQELSNLKEKNQLNENTQRSNFLRILSNYVLPLGFLLILIFLTYLFSKEVGIIVFFIGLLFVSGFLLYRKKKSSSLETHNLKVENEKIDIIRSEKAKLAKILQTYDVEDPNSFYSKKVEYLALKEKVLEVKNQLKGLLGENKVSQLEDKQIELSLRKRELEHIIVDPKLKNSELTAESYLARNHDLDKLKEKKSRLEKEQLISKTRAGDTEVEYYEIVALEEDLALAKLSREQLREKRAVLGLAIETLNEAILEVVKSTNKIFSDTIAVDLPKLTNNHYSKVKVKPDLTVEVYSEEKGGWVEPVEELSKGTVDQIYFLVRLAFLKLITENKKLPLILDDPLVSSDQLRREKFKELLENYSEQYQVLFFTNDPDYLDWGNIVQV